MNTIKFKKWDCKLEFSMYVNKRLRIDLVDAENYTQIATVTKNLPNEDIKPNQVIIKSYNGNEGMIDTLMNANIVSRPIRWVASGHVLMPVCKLLVDIPNLKDTCGGRKTL